MKSFLHIGCGSKRKDQTTKGFASEEWSEIRFDIDPSVEPDIVGTMLDMTGVQSGSVDAIFSSHNLEHLYAHEMGLAFKEFVRVLKPTGFLVVTCPDLQSVCALIAEDKLLDAAYESPAGPITPLDILYGHRQLMANGNLFMAHRCGFTESALRSTLRQNGFAAVATARRASPEFDLWAVASVAQISQDEIVALARAHFPC